MKNYKTSNLVLQKISLLIPLIIYSVYKNGYLLYEKNLIPYYMIFKSIYLIFISVIIKIIFDLKRFKRIKIDYDFLSIILIAMIMPYNINIVIYTISLAMLYFITILISKKIKFNTICFIYLAIVALNLIINPFTFKNHLELNYSFNFSFLDLLIGRSVGGIASTSIFFSLLAYIILINNYYYKKDIPFIINIIYLILSFIYFIFTSRSDILVNCDLIFASVFICSIPISSPYKRINQILYSIMIGIISFVLTIYYDSILSIFIATFIMSLFLNINTRQNKTKK